PVSALILAACSAPNTFKASQQQDPQFGDVPEASMAEANGNIVPIGNQSNGYPVAQVEQPTTVAVRIGNTDITCTLPANSSVVLLGKRDPLVLVHIPDGGCLGSDGKTVLTDGYIPGST